MNHGETIEGKYHPISLIDGIGTMTDQEVLYDFGSILWVTGWDASVDFDEMLSSFSHSLNFAPVLINYHSGLSAKDACDMQQDPVHLVGDKNPEQDNELRDLVMEFLSQSTRHIQPSSAKSVSLVKASNLSAPTTCQSCSTLSPTATAKLKCKKDPNQSDWTNVIN
ncbi:hypothetical protein BG004_004844 [Podila humilis]|nr:hypothetical protein BG004_004844 [Podila humilis]